MTRASKHTPGPMRVESDGTTIALGGQCVIMSPAPDGAGIEVERANAARIALCWNQHDEMLAALEELVAEWDSADFEARENPGYGGLRETGGVIQARAAIAAAKRGAA